MPFGKIEDYICIFSDKENNVLLPGGWGWGLVGCRVGERTKKKLHVYRQRNNINFSEHTK